MIFHVKKGTARNYEARENHFKIAKNIFLRSREWKKECEINTCKCSKRVFSTVVNSSHFEIYRQLYPAFKIRYKNRVDAR